MSSVQLVARTPGAELRGDTLFAPVIDEQVSETVQAMLPVVFFEKNSTEPVGGNVSLALFAKALHQSVVDPSDQAEHVTVYGSTSYDEDPRLARERISAVLQGVALDQNKVTVQLVPADSSLRPELAAEARYVKVQLGSTARMLHLHSEVRSTDVGAVELAALQTLSCENGPCTTAVTVQGAHTPYARTSEPVIPITVPERLADATPTNPVPVRVELVTTDAGGASTTASTAVVVQPTPRNSTRTVTRISPAGESSADAMLLGLFEFDSEVFSTIDFEVRDSVLAALRSGQAVVLIPGTDEIGTAEYNERLRGKRADAARAILGADAARLPLDAQPIISAPSATPTDRITKRSVWVRIGTRKGG
jgi:outer membrane protein OmpA-like peptidoglycan-associated protein